MITCECALPAGSPATIFEVWWAGQSIPNRSPAASFGQAVTWWIEAFDTSVWHYDQEATRWDLHRDRLKDPSREFTGLV